MRSVWIIAVFLAIACISSPVSGYVPQTVAKAQCDTVETNLGTFRLVFDPQSGGARVVNPEGRSFVIEEKHGRPIFTICGFPDAVIFVFENALITYTKTSHSFKFRVVFPILPETVYVKGEGIFPVVVLRKDRKKIIAQIVLDTVKDELRFEHILPPCD